MSSVCRNVVQEQAPRGARGGQEEEKKVTSLSSLCAVLVTNRACRDALSFPACPVRLGGCRAKRDEEEDDFEASDGDSDEGIDEGAYYHQFVVGAMHGP